MKMKKHFPPHLAQLVFVNLDGEIKKINALDYDLFIWLIYKTHQHYHLTKKTTVEFEYANVRDLIKSKPNTKSIQSSLKKIGELQLLSNYLGSYENKEAILTTQPFDIEIITSENGKSYGFKVTTSNKFLQRFDNPTPKVTVDYTIIYNLNKMSKLLYLFLKDAVGIYENKNRNVDIDNLKHMMNISSEKTSNSNFIIQLKKSIKDINDNSDITVDFEIVKKRNLKTGISEITTIKFSIFYDELKLQKKKIAESKTDNEIMTDETTDTATVSKTFDEYIDEKVEEAYQEAISNGTDIKNTKAYKNGIRKELLKDSELKSQFELVNLLEYEKLKHKIADGQPYMLVFMDGENEKNTFYINNEFQFVNCVSGEVQTDLPSETLESIESNLGNMYFHIQKCDYSKKYDVGRL